MTLPAGLLGAMMGGGAPGGGLASLIDIPCGVCLVSGTDAPRQARSLVAGTLVCDAYHAAVALERAEYNTRAYWSHLARLDADELEEALR